MLVDEFGNGIHSNRKFIRGAQRHGRATWPEPSRMKDLHELVPENDHDAIVSASRTLFANYGPVREAAIQKADEAVGDAWAPKFQGDNQDWGKLAKDWLINEWYGACDVRGGKFDFVTSLWLDSVAIDRDGDVGVYLTGTDSGYAQIQRVPAHRIGQRSEGDIEDGRITSGPYKGERIFKGVIVNSVGRAIGYRVLGDAEDGSEDVDIAAQSFFLLDEPEWHDEVRGLPSFAAGVAFVKSSLRSHEWEQQAQLMASAIGLMEYSEDGMADPDDPMVTAASVDSSGDTSGVQTELFYGGMVRHFKSRSGSKLEQLKHERPGEIWESFQDRVIRLSVGGCWPYELIWKPGSITGPLVRNVQERARKKVTRRQKRLKLAARRMVGYAIAKAIKAGRLPHDAEWWKWDFQMPRKFSIDPGRDGENFRRDYVIGRANMSDGVEEDGGTYEAQVRRRIDEVVTLEKLLKEARKKNPDLEISREHIQLVNPVEFSQEKTKKGEDEE